jgi:hypothetical protein
MIHLRQYQQECKEVGRLHPFREFRCLNALQSIFLSGWCNVVDEREIIAFTSLE